MKPDGFGAGCLLGFVLTAFLATMLALAAIDGTRKHWQSEAIKHGAAHYDPQTAEFRWNDVTSKGESK